MSIVIKNLTKTFDDGKKAIDNVSMTFKKNQITGLIGFNGSGKTTTFNILANFIEKYEGKISIGGKDIDKKMLKTFSYLAAGAEPKNPMKVKTHLYSIAYIYGVSKSEADVIIAPLAEKMEFTDMLSKPIKSLSKGNQQKIKVIAALLNPKLEYLFLDEPFDGLDPIMVEIIKKIFMELKEVTIIITSHRMDVVQSMCKEFFVLKEGVLTDKRQTSDKTIIVEVNKEVPITAIKKMKCVISTKLVGNKNVIVIDDIKNFKTINKKLISSPKYVYSSIKEQNIADSVFKDVK